MTIYLHLAPDQLCPKTMTIGPFRCVVIVESPDVSVQWRNEISRWLVDSGCLFMLAWGFECSKWDDSVDWANLEDFDYDDIPDDRFVYTTWHEKDTLDHVFWQAHFIANHDTVDIRESLLLQISKEEKEQEYLGRFEQARNRH